MDFVRLFSGCLPEVHQRQLCTKKLWRKHISLRIKRWDTESSLDVLVPTLCRPHKAELQILLCSLADFFLPVLADFFLRFWRIFSSCSGGFFPPVLADFFRLFWRIFSIPVLADFSLQLVGYLGESLYTVTWVSEASRTLQDFWTKDTISR